MRLYKGLLVTGIVGLIDPVQTTENFRLSNIINQSRVKQFAATIAASATILSGHVFPAFAVSVETVNSKLSSYGISPILYVPPGFAPVVSEFGRGNLKNEKNIPIVVQFAHPKNWVVQTTSVNGNGEAGTISANDYFKGDSAFLFVDNLVTPAGSTLSKDSKDIIQAYIQDALSQKGDPIESLQILDIKEGTQRTADKQPYVEVEFSYQLNTEAGFLVERHAVLALTSVAAKDVIKDGRTQSGTAVSAIVTATAGRGEEQASRSTEDTAKKSVDLQGLVAVTTGKRWRGGMDSQLRAVAQSFRVNRLNSGVFATAAGSVAE